MKNLKVLDLFSGTQSIAKAFRNKGHNTYTIELDKSHKGIDWYEDIMKITAKDIIKRFGHPDVVWASPPCFTESTLVLTKEGFKEIKDIREGDYVLTHNCRYRKVEKIGRKLTDSISLIKVSCSDVIETTNEHPFYARIKKRVWNNEKRGWDRVYGKPEWIQAKDLTKDYMVGMAINQECSLPIWDGIENKIVNQTGLCSTYIKSELNKYFNNEDFWWVIGRYIGDGWTRDSKNRKSFIICCADNEEKEITSVLDKLGDYFSYGVIQEKTVKKICIYKSELVSYVKQFGKYAYGKKLTNDIIDLPKNLLRSFLKGYFSADGYCDNRKNNNRIVASSVSKELIYGIAQCIVKAFEKPVSITVNRKSGTEIIEGRKVKVRDIYSVYFYMDTTKCHSFIENGILWTNIKNIEEVKSKKYVYNMTVNEDNTYTANGIIVHNCEKFSVAAIGKHWIKGTNLPKTEDTKKALALLEHTVQLIKELNPTYYFIENPRGKMRKMDCMQDLPRYTVTYCQYGDTRMKPTDLWTNHPNPKFKPPCHNGDTCHEAAPRGSRTGTQGIKGAVDRSRIPNLLCEHIVDISEELLNNRYIDLNAIAREIITIVQNESNPDMSGFQYEISYTYIENKFNFKLTNLLKETIKEELDTSEEVADTYLSEDGFDVVLSTAYAPNYIDPNDR